VKQIAALVIASVVLASCSSNSSTKASSNSTTTAAKITGNLNVFAAASLTGAFNNARTKLTTAHRGLNLTYNFAGSNALVAQVQQGAPADVFASADQKNMQTLVDAGLVEGPVTFAKNKLQIAVAAGNPKGITGLADLAKPGVTAVLEAPGVPAGDYTRQVLAAKGIMVTPKSLETDVKSAVAKVTSGEADATVVYVTDVTAGGPKVQGVNIPDADQLDISYPIAVLKATKNHAAAQAFVDAAVSGDVQKSLEAAGFSPAK
jgi:molybdate transport system substrate-binding protein